MPRGWNDRMHARLRAAARRCPVAEGWGGTASVDLEAFFTGQGNTFLNVPFPSGPGAVDAQAILGATGDNFVL